jgi:DNA-binding FrmR family transcriptional regulator
MIDERAKQESLNRLKRIEGQVRGVARMVQEEKYCIDILDQITAAKNALDGVVSDAIRKGEAGGKIEELVRTVYKHGNRLG